MDKIIVYDNFLKNEELKQLVDLINASSWKFGHESHGKYITETPFWNLNLNDNQFIYTTLKNIIEKTFSKKFKLIRVYANGQTFGQDGTYHQDSVSDNTYTFCLYVTNIKPEYVETAGGHICFKFPNEKYSFFIFVHTNPFL